jgi:peptidyl-prolyl cis-trans isomerase D
MISWMQKHRKYLVITIWISTIAFVGAGFVGWGAYRYGGMANNVAKVGDIPITMQEFQTAYGNLYQQYNRATGGKLDEATAKKMGLQKQVLQSLIYQALLKNFAKEYGIVVSDEEVWQKLLDIPDFRKNGEFDKSTYIAVLQNLRMKPKTFEANLKNEILLNKTLSLLNPDVAPLELEAFGSAVFMADKLRYKVFSAEEIGVDFGDDELKRYWKEHKSDYMTPRRYKLAILWITPSTELPEERAIESFYKEHRTDFTDSEGKILPLEKVREKVVEKLRLKASKKAAQLAYIDLKKGKKAPQEEKIVDAGDAVFPADIWHDIEEALPGTVLKPKIAGERYVVIKVVETILPQPKSFEKAYDEVKKEYLSKKRLELLQKMAEKASAELDDAQLSDYVTRESVDKLPPLTDEEADLFLQKLFSTNRPNGAILIDDKAVSYSIVEQKLLDSDKLKQRKTLLEENGKKMKSNLLRNNLIDRLQQKYMTEIYLKEIE